MTLFVARGDITRWRNWISSAPHCGPACPETAREGLELAIRPDLHIRLCRMTGRSYQIADSREAWFLHVVRGNALRGSREYQTTWL